MEDCGTSRVITKGVVSKGEKVESHSARLSAGASAG